MSAISGVPVALQLYSVREACAADLPATLRAVKAMGYDGVEFAGFYDYSAADLKALLDEIGLRVAGSHTSITLLEGDAFEATVAYNRAIGNTRLIVPAIPRDRVESGRAGWEAVAQSLCEIQARCAAAGVECGFHNHAVEFEPVDGARPLDLIVNATPAEFIIQIDIGWSFKAGVDARDCFAKTPGRNRTVHVKAHSATNQTACVGEDDVPWPEVLQDAVATGGAEWFIVEHEHQEGDPLASVKTCVEYLRSLGAGACGAACNG